MANDVKMVPALCTQCGGKVEVDANSDEAKCPYCGMSFLVQKAINNYNVKYATIEHADNVNIDMGGAVKEVLDFAGNQLNESRKEWREIRKEHNEQFKESSAKFMKMFIIMMPCMFAFVIIAFIILRLTGSIDDTDEQAVDTGSSISAYVENGCLYTEVTGATGTEWKYLEFDSMGTVLLDESNDVGDYHSCVSGAEDTEGVRYVVLAAYEEDNADTNNDPLYYSVTRVVVENTNIVEASEPVIVDSLSEYNYE